MTPDSSRSAKANTVPAVRQEDDSLEVARRRIEKCEAALEESEARFRNVIDRNADAIVVVGRDGTIKYANAAAGNTFQTNPAQMTGTPFGLPLLVGETTELDVVVAGNARVAEMRVTESTWDGAPVRLAMLRDITVLDGLRRDRAREAAIKLAADRLREIISQAPVAIAVVRGSNHTFDITNARYDELIGHRHVTGKPIREALPELEGQGIYELLDRVFSTGEPYIGTEVDVMIERRPGSVEETFFTFVYQPLREFDGTPLDDDGADQKVPAPFLRR